MASGIVEYKGDFKSKDYRIAIVASRFNKTITSNLLDGALETLIESGISQASIFLYWVPGAFEIPVACARIFSENKADGIITLGAVIRGETPHFEVVADRCSEGVMQVSLEYKKPVIFGVLTTNTVEQAFNRAGLKYGNKGSEAASTLLQMLGLFDQAGI